LPATCASGIEPAVPVPSSTTPIISSVSCSAIRRDITRTGSAPGPRPGWETIVVGIRTPSLATVCAALAMTSGVASTSPWPIALTPRSSSSPTSRGIDGDGGSIMRTAASS
jgi:hypothetical protein